MNLEHLEKELEASLLMFREEMNSNIGSSKDPNDKLNYYDYEEIARQTFYVLDSFKDNIIKYLNLNK